MNKVNLCESFKAIEDHWQPRVAGTLNGQEVKLVKFQGTFPWHHHETEDELFLVFRGSFVMELRGSSIHLQEGEFLIVPKGTEHRPVAGSEVEVLLFEPAGTRNTGNVVNEFTRAT
ncbi:MAG: cupin domain-containing protein [Acidobacteriota bacterium]|nr:cupin domain-containing protein [Acidobacteriota bacterium]